METKDLKLSEEEKVRLEALFLRAELLARDSQTLFSELQATNRQIAEFIYQKAQEQGMEISSYQPRFRNYRLEGVSVTLRDSASGQSSP